MFNPKVITAPRHQNASAIFAIALPALVFAGVSVPTQPFELNKENKVILASSDIIVTATLDQAPPVVITPNFTEEGHFAAVGSGDFSPTVGGSLRNLPEA